MCDCQPETFFTLFYSAPHWLFEIFLMALFDGLLFSIIWPYVHSHMHRPSCVIPLENMKTVNATIISKKGL